MVKIHVHTFTPEKVLEYAHRFGEFITIKIENMSVQHTSVIKNTKGNDNSGLKNETTNAIDKSNADTAVPEMATRKKYGVVAVATAEKIANVFKDLGADSVIRADAKNTPSAKDFLDAFDKANAEFIFVLPNNSNIFLAAEQAASMHVGSKICIIKTTSIGIGYSVLSSMNFENENYENILLEANKSMQNCVCGYTSVSIRSININDLNIKKGDNIGVIEKKIVFCGRNKISIAYKTAKELLKNKFVITVFAGKDVTEENCLKLKKLILSDRNDAEVYFIDSGQDIYQFIFVAE